MFNSPTQMEPLFPTARAEQLADLAVELVRQSAALGSRLRGPTREAVITLLRQMNSYYSNLIEGHHTQPIDIERAMKQEYAEEPAKRLLQFESKAHIEVQELIEAQLEKSPDINICSPQFLTWIHRIFYERMPAEFRWITDKDEKERHEIVPGELRNREVVVGRHVPPTFTAVNAFLERFATAFDPARLGRVPRVVAAAASHHRFAWIHPFLDGNGRVTRLFTHAYLIKAGVDGHRLWMVSRGFARRRDEYIAALVGADAPRKSDHDGRGNLSDEGLSQFCDFFLQTALDQVAFMGGMLELDRLENRITAYIERRATLNEIDPAGAFLLRDVLLRGEVARGEASRITGKPERTARRIVNTLLEENLLTSETPKGPLRIGFPTKVVGYYFPRLYPEGVEHDIERATSNKRLR
ncbi:MAG: Fic family protein [Acidobacteria bacterium]|nr:MAG: Fic family protein [Acidobacteriota bacterium]